VDNAGSTPVTSSNLACETARCGRLPVTQNIEGIVTPTGRQIMSL